MSQHGYSYVIVRYSPDLGAGECLNVGVVLAANDGSYLELLLDERKQRLGCSFGSFDRKSYSQWVRSFRTVCHRAYSDRTHTLFKPDDGRAILPAVLERARRDPSLSIKFSEERYIEPYRKPDRILRDLFDRYVDRQAPSAEKSLRRDDQDVWRVFREQLSLRQLSRYLGEAEVPIKKMAPLRFEHAYRNGKLHLLQPMTFDYTEAERIRDKAVRWLGYAQSFEDVESIGGIYFLVAKPSDWRLQQSYDGALESLSDLPIRSRVYEDVEAKAFAADFERLVHANG